MDLLQWKWGQQYLPTALSTHSQSETAIRSEMTNSWYLEDSPLFVHPGSCKLCAGCSRDMCTVPAMGLDGGGHVVASELRTETD